MDDDFTGHPVPGRLRIKGKSSSSRRSDHTSSSEAQTARVGKVSNAAVESGFYSARFVVPKGGSAQEAGVAPTHSQHQFAGYGYGGDFGVTMPHQIDQSFSLANMHLEQSTGYSSPQDWQGGGYSYQTPYGGSSYQTHQSFQPQSTHILPYTSFGTGQQGREASISTDMDVSRQPQHTSMSRKIVNDLRDTSSSPQVDSYEAAHRLQRLQYILSTTPFTPITDLGIPYETGNEKIWNLLDETPRRLIVDLLHHITLYRKSSIRGKLKNTLTPTLALSILSADAGLIMDAITIIFHSSKQLRGHHF
ncbi:hypothetical protein CBS101457_000237 [Exobasidium rhododendri]|nr:hypothetical protein CBS101457_000237 [Exobasidium rhododendri]